MTNFDLPQSQAQPSGRDFFDHITTRSLMAAFDPLRSFAIGQFAHSVIRTSPPRRHKQHKSLHRALARLN
jgi:hypothetical protein